MRQSILTGEQNQLLQDEKSLLKDIMLRLAEIGIPQDRLETLHKSSIQLDELFMIVVVGEFNSGKSALINAILGEKVLPEGVTPTTSRVTLVKWGEKIGEQILDDGFAVVTYPLELLKDLNIVDSPGTNAIIRQHERLTDEYIPRSDLVLFTTSAERPLTESERQFLARILSWGKKVIFVLNKTDIFENDAALQEARDYILQHATSMLGELPGLFPVSARMAQRAKMETNEAERQKLLEASHLSALERYIDSTLDDKTKLMIKFQNPLGVAGNLVELTRDGIQTRAESLKEDKETVNSIEVAIAAYKKDLEQELTPRLAEIENILHKLEFRGLDFFDRTIRLTNIHHLAKGDRIRTDFDKEVIGDMPQQIDDQVKSLIDWLVEKDLREWQQVMSYLQRRQAVNMGRIVGGAGSLQEDHRQEIIEKVEENVKTIVESYDRLKEGSQLSASVESAVAQTALLEVGAVGLGTLVATVVASSALDITGMIAAGTLAIIGFFVIPFKRKQARDHFREKIVTLRTTLNETLKTTFERESQNAITRMNNNIAPYSRYVHAETDKTDRILGVLDDLKKKVGMIMARIDVEFK